MHVTTEITTLAILGYQCIQVHVTTSKGGITCTVFYCLNAWEFISNLDQALKRFTWIKCVLVFNGTHLEALAVSKYELESTGNSYDQQ